MEKQFLKPQTAKTPEIHLNSLTGHFLVAGKSIPENAFEFYKPVFDWIFDYKLTPAQHTELVFKLNYFNSSSTEFILQLIKEMEKLHLDGFSSKVVWMFDREDEDMEEVGRDFQQIVQIEVELLAL